MSDATRIDDDHNRQMLDLVQTEGRELVPAHHRYDLVAIGGGTGGLVATSGAALLGARVALIESNLLGGDCLVSGCVPSKALLHAARVAHDARTAESVGITTTVQVDGERVMERVRRIRSEIAHDDSVATLQERGVEVISGRARFIGKQELAIDGRPLSFKRAIIATGARATIPTDIEGLAEAGPLTHETLFELPTLPRRVVVIGGGPIGCELGQALARLGSTVTLVQRGQRLLPADDPQAGELIEQRLRAEGVDVRCGCNVRRVGMREEGTTVHLDDGAAVECDRVVVAVGRRPALDELGLDHAAIEHGPRGVVVDRFGRTSNRRVFAVGDVAAGPQFTHAAWAQAEFATLNAFFPARMDIAARVMPHVTYTDPEVGHVGLSPAALAELGDDVTTLSVPWHDNDRAHTDDEHHGFARVHLRGGSDRILAATAVGRGAGEIIAEISLAMTAGIGLAKLGRAVHPYPTRSEVWRTLSYQWQTDRIGAGTRRLVGWWLRLLR